VFIRTDQLDGETDWKLRKAIALTQQVSPSTRLISTEGQVVANALMIKYMTLEDTLKAMNLQSWLVKLQQVMLVQLHRREASSSTRSLAPNVKL